MTNRAENDLAIGIKAAVAAMAGGPFTVTLNPGGLIQFVQG